MNKVVQLLRQSFSGNEIEIHESEQILLNMDISCDYVTTLFDIIKNENMDSSIKYSALIRLKQIVEKNWLVSLNSDIKSLFVSNYLEILYSIGPSFNKLFQLFSNLIIDGMITLNECPDLFSLVQNDSENQLSSLILIKSIARHFKMHIAIDENEIYEHVKIDKNDLFERFCMFFIQSKFQLFIDSQSYTEILLIYRSFYYLISNNPSYFKTIDPQIILAIISKFEIFSEFKDDETYQRCLKHSSKLIYLILIKSIIPIDIPSDLLISTFNISLHLFIENLKPNTRNHLTRLICKLFDYQVITNFFFNDVQNFIENIFLQFFNSKEIKGELFDHKYQMYDPLNSSIYIIQYLSIKQPVFIEILNSYLFQSIQHLSELTDQSQFNDEAMTLFARAKLASSSLQLSDESLLQIPLFQSDVEILRIIAFTISANFNGVLPSILFPICLEHLSDESGVVCQLSAVSAIKCLQNKNLEIDEEDSGFISPLFEAYLTITENPDSFSISSLKLLKKLLKFSGSPGVYSNPILSSLTSHLIRLSTEESNDSELVSTICKRICQILQLNSIDPDFESESDSFVNELINIYDKFNDFFKEKILPIFETSAEFCFTESSWSIVSIFEFGNIIEDEMMVLRKLLISARINSVFDMDSIQYILNKLFEHIEKDPDDEEIVLNSLSDILSCLFGLNDENVDLLIHQEILPLILDKIQTDSSISDVSNLSRIISCIFIFFKKCDKEFDYQPFIEFWIENAEYPYYCASSISIIQNLNFDSNLYLAVLLKTCDELSDFFKENDSQISDEFEFPDFTIKSIITDLLKLIKYLKEKLPEFYILFHQKASVFIDEVLPEIVDSICS